MAAYPSHAGRRQLTGEINNYISGSIDINTVMYRPRRPPGVSSPPPRQPGRHGSLAASRNGLTVDEHGP